MRTDVSATASKTLNLVPPMALNAAPAGLTDEEFSALVDPHGMIPEGLAPYLDLLRKDNPKTLPQISELLTTGNETARKLATRKFSLLLNEIANAYTANPAKWIRGMPPKTGSPQMEAEIAKNWAIGNVAEELGIDMSSDREYHNIHGPVSNTHFLQQGGTTNSAAKTTAYWRGTIAFNQTTIEWRERDKHKVHAFISWAGKQENLRMVIDLASERNTLDVDTLAGVLKEQDSLSPVRDGVL
jgi:hypothetical protein